MHRFLSLLLIGSILSCFLCAAAETVSFGHYEQDNDLSGNEEPISWLILDEQDDRILLLSEYVLDCRPYHPKYNDKTSYETSEIRSWLNEVFLAEAFTDDEREQILQVSNTNLRKKGYASKDGNITEDVVFLLSFDQVETYLPTKQDRIAEATPYAKSLGVRTKKGSACPWWLRTPGRRQHHAACVTLDGGYYDYFDITCPTNGIRPAVWIRKSGF